MIKSDPDPLALALVYDDDETRLEALNSLLARARKSPDANKIVVKFGFSNYAAVVAERDTLATRLYNARYQKRLAARGERLVTLAAPVERAAEVRAFSKWLSEREEFCG
jgi:hypothetical protein